MSDDLKTGAVMPPHSSVLGVGVHDVSIDAYLLDPCEAPSLRSSDINRMLSLTPQHVHAAHPRLTQFPGSVEKPSKSMDLGSVVHAMLLGSGAQFIARDCSDFATKNGDPAKTWGAAEAKAWKDEQESRGMIVISTDEYAAMSTVRTNIETALAGHFGSWPLGKAEQSIVWQEETPHGLIWCRTRPDVVAWNRALVIDIKTCGTGLSDDDIRRTLSADNGRVVMQGAWQIRGAEAVRPDLAGRFTHVLLFVETAAPYLARAVHTSMVSLEMAKRRCLRAAFMFASCLAADSWPGWSATELGLAPWADARWAADEIQELNEGAE